MTREHDKLIHDALRFIADLNGSEWIKGEDAGSKDMRQRAKALHKNLAAHVYGTTSKPR